MEERDLMEQIVSREVLYEGCVVQVEKWAVRLPNGKPATREAVLHLGAVAVVACDRLGRIAMVRQHRVVVGQVLLEVPAGKLDAKGENHLAAAQRELREETGLTANTWTHLSDVLTTPGFCSEQIGLYLATDLREGDLDPDEDEFLNACRIPASQLYESIFAGELTDLKSVAALLLANPYLEDMKLI